MSSVQFRRAFTLIELLVVITLILILAGIAVYFFPNAASAARESRAAQSLQGWLNIAKQRAMRDQSPRGLRLWVTTSTIGTVTLNNVVTDCQFIEQPEDLAGGEAASLLPSPPPPAPLGYTNLNVIQLTTLDLTNGQPKVILPNVNDPFLKTWTVQPGDCIEIYGGGLSHRIVQVGVPNAVGAVNQQFVKISPPLSFQIPANPPAQLGTREFKIVRSPRASGDETLKLPEGTLIDLGTNIKYKKPVPPVDPNLGAGYVDILFAPSGQVISKGLSEPNVHLWVRAPDQDPANATNEFRGDPTIVSVFARTGFVGAYGVDPNTAGNPYTLVR